MAVTMSVKLLKMFTQLSGRPALPSFKMSALIVIIQFRLSLLSNTLHMVGDELRLPAYTIHVTAPS